MSEHRRIPVLIVTGFLGAGKTTFLNWLIRSHRHLKLALVENEFGAVSIDRDLIAGIRTGNVYDLSSGCICCSISNEFSLTLTDLAEQAGDLDFLLIETTGIADLGNVIRPLCSEKDLTDRFSYQGSICLVDALNYNEQLRGGEQQMQVILSDLLLINKSAGVEESELLQIERLLSAYNSSAKLVRGNFGQPEEFRLESFTDEIHGILEKKLARPVMFRLIESERYVTFTHKFAGEVNVARFQHWFYYFAAVHQSAIYRIKGILYPENSPGKLVVQSVAGTVTYTPGSMIIPGEEQMNTLVFIGKQIDPEKIVYELEEYLREDDF